MINLIDRIAELTGIASEVGVKTYQYSVINGKICYVEGHNGIDSISTEQVVFRLGKQYFAVYGKALEISHLSKGDAVISAAVIEGVNVYV